MKYAFFLGCTAPVRAQNYELSTRKIADALGIEIVDLNFNCCGFPLQPVSQETALVMAARNLAIAEENGLNIVTICNACAGMLSKANKLLKADEKVKASANEHLKELGYEYRGSIDVKHFIKVLNEDVGLTKIRERIVKPLDGLNVATHYGCHYSRPSEIYDNFDDPEEPVLLDKLVEATGARSVSYKDKKGCCGGYLLGIDEGIALAMSNEKLSHVKGIVNAIVVICPFCGLMYDFCQIEIETRFNREYRIPVLYYPQLLGLAMGFSADELGLELNHVDPANLINMIESAK